MHRNVIITCAVTGAGDTVDKNPEVPVTPQQIAESALAAAEAGAAIVHIHVRDPKTGQADRRFELYEEVVQWIRSSGSDVVINLTAGMGGDFIPSAEDPASAGPGSDMASAEERVAHIEKLRPDICSFDCGSLNYATSAFVATPDQLREMALRIKEAKVKPEIEVFELGHIWLAKQLIREGLIEPSPLFQLCLGIPWGAEANTETMVTMRNMLPADANWCGFAIGKSQMPFVAQSMLLGGHVRVGLEDNIYLKKGVPARNEDLVSKAAAIIEHLGSEVASPAEAREQLGLS